jgi:hypothetical protein
MAYTRPAYYDADASFFSRPAYTRPAYNDADATFVQPVVAVEAILADSGLPLAPSFQSSPWAVARLEDGGLPLPPSFIAVQGYIAWLETESPLSSPTFYAIKGIAATLSDGGLPSPLLATVYTDPTPYIDPSAAIRYVMDLVVDGAYVRLPISSWQATLQTDSDSYAQCVVPACAEWLDTINSATEFIVYRVGTLYPQYGGTVESQVFRAPLETLQVSRGATNYSAVMSGYFDPLPTSENPDAMFDRTLPDVRSVSTYGDTISIRCGIDWLLMPGQRAIYGSVDFVVSYINYYVTSYAATIDAYMDVGTRS